MSGPSQTPAQRSASESSSATGGGHGPLSRAGTMRGGTLPGRKQSEWNSSSDPSSKRLPEARGLESTETTEASWKDGGQGGAETNRQMKYSNESILFSA